MCVVPNTTVVKMGECNFPEVVMLRCLGVYAAVFGTVFTQTL